jgi:hypothetical protein
MAEVSTECQIVLPDTQKRGLGLLHLTISCSGMSVFCVRCTSMFGKLSVLSSSSDCLSCRPTDSFPLKLTSAVDSRRNECHTNTG